MSVWSVCVMVPVVSYKVSVGDPAVVNGCAVVDGVVLFDRWFRVVVAWRIGFVVVTSCLTLIWELVVVCVRWC